MKRVINGKAYNTETAECLCESTNGYHPQDFKYCKEALYQTKKGAYFIFGVGGGLSKYAERYGDAKGEGSKIKVVDEYEAMRWLEERQETEILEKYFSDKIEEA